jgi:hypothetical protein
MNISEDRMLGLSMLSRDFVKRQEYSSAALAAQMLSETYTKGVRLWSVNLQANWAYSSS